MSMILFISRELYTSSFNNTPRDTDSTPLVPHAFVNMHEFPCGLKKVVVGKSGKAFRMSSFWKLPCRVSENYFLQIHHRDLPGD